MHSRLIGALSVGILIGVILGIVASRTARAPGSALDVMHHDMANGFNGAGSAPVPVIAGGGDDAPLDTAAEESKLVEIVRTLHRGVETGELSSLQQYGSAGMEGFLGERVTAKEFIEEFSRRYLPAGRVRVQANEISAHVVGRAGWTTSDETWTLEANSPAPRTVRILSTIVFTRDDGQWRMAHVHQSPVEPLMDGAAPAAPAPLLSGK